jgi:tryptophan-rich sensory protein
LYLAEDEYPLFALALGAYVFAPWAFLVFRARGLGSRARGVAVGVLAAMTVCTYVVVATDDSSTAALALLFLPAYQWATIGAIGIFTRAPGGA